MTPEQFNTQWQAHLPGHLGIVVTHVAPGELHAEMAVVPQIASPDGHLHAGSVAALAVHAAGCGCVADLPPGTAGFTMLEFKANHLSSPRDGRVLCVARRVHGGRSTQVWDVEVTHAESGKAVALFRCTQMLLVARG
jgi:1,4-dihydroxy-2-naphthoyl-CoA hydrolase